MAVDTIAGLKAKMPVNTPGGTTIADMYDLLDTLGDFTTQEVLTKTASYTATAADNRRRIVFNSATAVTFTLPNSLSVGWECVIMQLGAGAVTVSVTGGNLRHLSSHTKTGGVYAQAYMFVYQNAGTSPQVAFSGQTAL
jgi:hypothetical protein